MAQGIMNTSLIPIRYKKNAYQEIVMIPTYEIQRSTSFMNMVIAIIGTSILAVICIFITRYANNRAEHGAEQLVIERVDV